MQIQEKGLTEIFYLCKDNGDLKGFQTKTFFNSKRLTICHLPITKHVRKKAHVLFWKIKIRKKNDKWPNGTDSQRLTESVFVVGLKTLLTVLQRINFLRGCKYRMNKNYFDQFNCLQTPHSFNFLSYFREGLKSITNGFYAACQPIY